VFGGVGTIGGTMIGAFLIAVVTNGAVLLNITQYWQQVIIGVIIWLAVWWDQVRRRRLSAASEQMERRKAGGDDQRGGARAEPGSAHAQEVPEAAPPRLQYSQNDYNTALTVTSNILTANPDLKGLFAANESSDVGAVEAVRIAHRVDKVKIVGWDTSPDEVDGVRQGVVAGLISQDPFRMGYDGVRAAVAMLRHEGRPQSENTGEVFVTRHDLNNPVVRQFVTPKCGSPRQVDVG
jgi:ABC-type xylose transport system substrate-binding protein